MLDRRLATFLFATLCACGPSPPDPILPALDPPPPPPPAAPLLADDPAVRHDDFARRVLYTWTTGAQVDALRASRRLLVATADDGERSPFLRALDDLVNRRAPGHELAALLRDHPALARRRYAWTSPLATVLGLGERRYGDRLIRVELDPAALLLAFRPARADAPFALVDMSGGTVPIDQALADPGRIAAVYHVRDGPDDPVPFREYVLCNEVTLSAWSIATPEIRARVDADLALLDALAAGDFAHLPDPAVRAPAAPAWAGAPPLPNPLDRWHALLAFDNDRYRPTPGNLARIAAALRRYDDRGPPLVHRLARP